MNEKQCKPIPDVRTLISMLSQEGKQLLEREIIAPALATSLFRSLKARKREVARTGVVSTLPKEVSLGTYHRSHNF